MNTTYWFHSKVEIPLCFYFYCLPCQQPGIKIHLLSSLWAQTAILFLLNICKYFVLFSCPLWSCYLSKTFWENTCMVQKHAAWHSLTFISISPNGASSSSHWLHDKHRGLCLLLILWRECRQKINKLLILHPIWQWLFSFPVFQTQPQIFPSSLLVPLNCCFAVAAFIPPLWVSIPSCSTFPWFIPFYKKYNPIDPKPDGKRWCVNRQVLNKKHSVLQRGEGWMGGWVVVVVGLCYRGRVLVRRAVKREWSW